MSIVVFFDQKTGEILKIEPHPEWGEREVRLRHLQKHPLATEKGTGVLALPDDFSWGDRGPESWRVVLDKRGLPQLVPREDREAESEIEALKEIFLLESIMNKLSPLATGKAEKRLQELKGLQDSKNFAKKASQEEASTCCQSGGDTELPSTG